MVIANYGDYPLIDEFKGDYTTGMDLYNNAKTITVSSGGSGTEGGNVNNEEDEESSSSSRKPMAPRDVTDPDKCDPDSASADDPGNDPNDNLDTNTDDPNTEETGDVKCEPDTTDTAGDTNTTDTDEKCDTDEESDTATDTAADSTDLGDQCDTDETDMSSDATTDTYDLGDVCDPDESSEYSSAMPTSTTSTTSVVTSTTSSVFSEYQSSSNGQSSSEDTDLGGLDSDSSSPTPTSSEEPSSTTSCYALPVVNSNEPGLKCSVPTNGPTESSSDDSIATDVDSSYPKFEIILMASVSAHMALIEPCSRYTPNNPKCPPLPAGQSLDYDLKNPIGSSDPLIKHTVPYATPAVTWTAGQSVTVNFEQGGAAHGGGHCEFSLSYDGGKTFVVIHQELKYCFFTGPSTSNTASVLSYTFNIPANVPSSNNVLFSWSWVNAIGNREFYRTISDVAITGSSSNSFTGPQMVVANHDGYPTIPEFGSDYTTGLDYYTNAPKITVTGSGGSTGGGSSNTNSTASSASSAVAATSSAAKSTASPGTPHNVQTSGGSGAASAPVSVPPSVGSTNAPASATASSNAPAATASSAAASGGGECTSGLLRCSGKGYQICNESVWSPVYSCGVGASCKGTDGHIYCGWP
ncbi:hypothetical protein GGI02_004328 [Coemansia sp. RSA 2322]|nr:hypothetical protein GGI02_004328 [Coemansia sp. RSA 2322]KAJ2480460.1 hypothetical protein EV174_003721 [Coemansia sp. RSA 2320]